MRVRVWVCQWGLVATFVLIIPSARSFALVLVTDWKSPDFPQWVRVLLVIGALSMSLSCYMAQLLGASCFRVRSL